MHAQSVASQQEFQSTPGFLAGRNLSSQRLHGPVVSKFQSTPGFLAGRNSRP